MRECWINVYPGIMLDGRVFCGKPQPSRLHCDVSAIGWAAAEDSGRSVAKDLRYVGVGYRLRVRLKPVPEPEPVGMTHGQWERIMGRR